MNRESNTEFHAFQASMETITLWHVEISLLYMLWQPRSFKSVVLTAIYDKLRTKL